MSGPSGRRSGHMLLSLLRRGLPCVAALEFARHASAEEAPFRPHGKSVVDLQSAMTDGSATSRSLCEYCILRIHSIDSAGPRVRSVLEINPDALATADRLDAERAAGATRGKLHGVPVLLKDNIDAGDLMRSTAGSLALMESRACGDAHVVALLRAQGAIILGKCNLSEWANFRGQGGHSGWSGVGHQTRNPHVLDRSPIGSSSGSAAAVAHPCQRHRWTPQTPGSSTTRGRTH